MKPFLYIVLCIVLFAGCGVRMQHLELVDEWGNSFNNERQQQFADKEIFSNLSADIWGLEQTDCKHFSRIDSVSFKGKSSLMLQWNKAGNCPWIGFGIGWNGYAAKDLTSVMQTGNITFYIRAINNIQYIPTLIFLLEDYSGVQTAAPFKAKYLERYPINVEWQKVTIPLSAFLKANAPLSDFSNIKSLNVECQGEGAVFIDEIFIEEGIAKNKNKIEKFGESITKKLPAIIFNDHMQYAWGLGKIDGREVTIDNHVYLTGNASLQLKWRTKTIPNLNKQLGFNWERWQAISLPDSINSYQLTFYLFAPNIKDVNNLQIGFESYTGEFVNVSLNQSLMDKQYHLDKQGRIWQKFIIPFSLFNWNDAKFNTQRFKQLVITFSQEGNVWIDQIQLEKQ